MLRDEALRAVQDPAAPPTVLAQVAGEFPDLRPQVAAHPGAYPGLLSWLAAGGDPAVDAALAARRAAPAGYGAPTPPYAPQPQPYTPAPPAAAHPTPPYAAPPYAQQPTDHQPYAPGGHAVPQPQPAPPYPHPTAPYSPYAPGAGYAVGPQVAVGTRSSAQRRARVTLISVLAGLVLVLLVGVAAFLAAGGGSPSAEPAGPGVADPSEGQASDAGAPGSATPNHGLLAGAGDESAPVTVEVYVDYMCPICGQFEAVNGESLAALREAGSVRVVFHPIAILDRYSQGSQYSTRAASSAALVADRAPDAFQDFHAGLLAHQPQEGTEGLSDAQIADVARAAGVPADVVAELADGGAAEFAPWVATATQAATSDPALAGPRGFGTPTIVIDGERWAGDWSDAQSLVQAIEGTAV
ncbi:thioredoxin domain-containing protein [Oerskovia sp. Root918]|uniref:DsbA family protein n=1 Tax=Oerskovia sp. Root918 TaxID=1736607 RepID=UPI0009EC3966|nr:thioredoxin domain-containing protein [Oerskovia sp. Root918]